MEAILSMKVLIVTQYFWPENFRINDLCAALSERGHDVTVLTGKPNYPDGKFFADFTAQPAKYDHYLGCDIIRVPIVSRGTGSGLKLLCNYLSFFLSASTLGLMRLRKKKFDVVFVCQLSPVTIAIPAIVYKKLFNTPIVMWVLDLWPESLESVGIVKSKKGLNYVGKLVSYIYKQCDLVLGQSKAFHEGISKYCHDQRKIRYFPSWAESIFSEGVDEINTPLICDDGVFKVLFAGNLGEAQDFNSVLKAVEILKADDLKVKVFIVGDGRQKEWLKEQIIERHLDNYICLLGRFPLEDMPAFYAAADALLVTLKDSPIFSMTIPGKVQSYMAAGKPILSMLSGEGSRVIDEGMCGLTAKSGDYRELAANIIEMSNMSRNDLAVLGENAQGYVSREFDRDILITQLEQWFLDVSKTCKGPIN